MDASLRALVRRVEGGDSTAAPALREACLRASCGWWGEPLRERLTLGEAWPVYVWESPLPCPQRGTVRLALVRVTEGVWVGRSPVAWRDYEAWRRQVDGSLRTRRSPAGAADDAPVLDRPWSKADGCCRALGLSLPRAQDLERLPASAFAPQGMNEWCDRDRDDALPLVRWVGGRGVIEHVSPGEPAIAVTFRAALWR